MGKARSPEISQVRRTKIRNKLTQNLNMSFGKLMTKSCRNNHKKKKSRLKNKRNYLVLENKSKFSVPESKSSY